MQTIMGCWLHPMPCCCKHNLNFLNPPIVYSGKIVVKAIPKGYPESFKHIGDHIRAKRLTDELQLKELARLLKTNISNLLNWELGDNYTTVQYMKAITSFLNYWPLSLLLKEDTAKLIWLTVWWTANLRPTEVEGNP